MKNKKIGILTQPLHQNYGGLLQAYALQLTLKRMGYKPCIIDRFEKRPSALRKLASHFKTIIYKSFGKTRDYTYWPSFEEEKFISQHTDYFIDKYIQPKSPRLYTKQELNDFVEEQKFSAFVVGSDQVWRPRYSPHLPTYFLDFVKNKSSIKKIAYAASFGVDRWEYTNVEAKIAKELAPLFDAISVREDSGVDICAKYLGVEADHVLDPTMLLNKEDYISLFKSEGESQSGGDLFSYILDSTDERAEIIAFIANKLSLIPFSVQAKSQVKSRSNYKKNIDDLIIPPVSKWLRAFYDAKFVVTDSFHGCVFSIIFNKPFIALGNKDRGLARFNSLLSLYGLENRLYNGELESFETINWASINSIRMNLKDKSLDFLISNLDGK